MRGGCMLTPEEMTRMYAAVITPVFEDRRKAGF